MLADGGHFLLCAVSRCKALQGVLTPHQYSYYPAHFTQLCEPIRAPWAIVRARADCERRRAAPGETRSRRQQETAGEGHEHVEPVTAAAAAWSTTASAAAGRRRMDTVSHC